MEENTKTIIDIDVQNDDRHIVECPVESNKKITVNSNCLKSPQNNSNSSCLIERINQRAQIDVIDMPEYETNKYTCFFVYEEQFSKYIVLKAVENNCIDEIVEKLIDIFLLIGAPNVIQSSNGRDYAENLVKKIIVNLPDVDITHDHIMKDRHIEKDFKSLVRNWQKKNPTRQWHESLKYIQISQNFAINEKNIKPATFIFNQNIFLDLERIMGNSESNDKLEFNENQDKLVCSAFKNINNNINNHQLISETKKKVPFNKLESNKKMEEKSNMEFVENNEISSKCHYDQTPKISQCNICSKSFQSIDIYDKHTLECCNQKINHSIDAIDKSDNKANELLEIDKKSQSNGIKKLNYPKVIKQNSLDNNSKKLINRSTSREERKSKKSVKLKNNPLLECKYCKHHFNFPSVLKRHMRTHTNERPYICQFCSKSFKQLGHLSQHLLTHTDYRSFQCTICGLKCQSLDALKIHSLTHKDILKNNNKLSNNDMYRLYECDNCKKVFTTKSVLERHILTHTHERHFGCKLCGKRFKQAGHVKSHMLIHTGERKFSCTICTKRFSLSNALKKHMYVHNGEKPYQCDVCGSRFLEKRNLNGHLMTHTNERPFCCKICGKKYTLADTLKRHVSAAHEDGRTYQCEICAKMFKQLAHLSVHKKVHTDERPFSCYLCEKTFKHKNVLKSHLAIHANIRPFECDICKGTFVRKTNLQTHIASAHMNERPYICTICNKRFKQISHLNGHIVVHSNSLPFQCEFCERRCNRLDNLKKHMKLHAKSKDSLTKC